MKKYEGKIKMEKKFNQRKKIYKELVKTKIPKTIILKKYKSSNKSEKKTEACRMERNTREHGKM